MQRVKAAGAVILGKTNVPVALGDWQSYNDIYGVTNNPYDLARTPGGSSGGSSAALAAGLGRALARLRHRRLAARARAFLRHLRAQADPQSRAAARLRCRPSSPLCRARSTCRWSARWPARAADLAALLDVIAGPDELDDGVGYRLALPAPRFTSLSQARVLVLTEHPLAPVDAPIAAALDRLAAELEKAGTRVSRASRLLPDFDLAARIYIRLLFAIVTARMPEEAAAPFIEAARGLSPEDPDLARDRAVGSTLAYRQWFADNGARQSLRAVWRAFFHDFDALICPVTPTAAFPHNFEGDQEARRIIVNGEARSYGENVVWPGVATLPGLPATAFPLGRTPAGLPFGAQAIGPWLEDRTTLELAKLIERDFGGFVAPEAWA